MRRPSARTFRLVAMTAASAAVAACGLSSAAPNTLLSGPAGQPITVGISEPLFGPAQAQGFAADGQACLKGYQLWASDLNSHGGLLGHPVKLIVLNDKGVPSLDAKNYQTLITKDKVNLTLAPFSSLLTATGAAPVTNRYGYALAAGQAGAPSVYALGYRTLFSTNVPVEIQMKPFADWVTTLQGALRPKTAAYPIVNNPFASPPVLEAQKILEHAGISTVYMAPGKGANIGYNNLSPRALQDDARQVVKSGAQMVVLGSVDVPTVQAFIKDFIQQKFEPKIFIAAAGPDQGQAFINAIGGPGNSWGVMVPNAWYGGFPNALSHVMVQDYIAKYGGTASGINADVAESYSAGETLAAAVKATGGTNQQQLISWLHKNTVQTVIGPVAFGPNGVNTDAGSSAVIFQWQPGQGGTGARFVQVLPPGRLGSIQPIANKPPWAG